MKRCAPWLLFTACTVATAATPPAVVRAPPTNLACAAPAVLACVDALRAEGKLDREVRVLAAAEARCPELHSALRESELAIALELGTRTRALELAREVLADPRATSAEVRDAKVVITPRGAPDKELEAHRLERAEQALAAGDACTAAGDFEDAWYAGFAPRLLVRAGEAARRCGNAVQAQRLFDRARAAYTEVSGDEGQPVLLRAARPSSSNATPRWTEMEMWPERSLHHAIVGASPQPLFIAPNGAAVGNERGIFWIRSKDETLLWSAEGVASSNSTSAPAVDRDGTRVALIVPGGIDILAVPSLKLLSKVRGPAISSMRLDSVEIVDAGRLLLGGRADDKTTLAVYSIDTASSRALHSMQDVRHMPIFSASRRFLALAEGPETSDDASFLTTRVFVYDLTGKQPRGEFSLRMHYSPYPAMAFSPDERSLLVAASPDALHVYDVRSRSKRTLTNRALLRNPTKDRPWSMRSVGATVDGIACLFCGEWENPNGVETIALYDLRRGRPITAGDDAASVCARFLETFAEPELLEPTPTQWWLLDDKDELLVRSEGVSARVTLATAQVSPPSEQDFANGPRIGARNPDAKDTSRPPDEWKTVPVHELFNAGAVLDPSRKQLVLRTHAGDATLRFFDASTGRLLRTIPDARCDADGLFFGAAALFSVSASGGLCARDESTGELRAQVLALGPRGAVAFLEGNAVELIGDAREHPPALFCKFGAELAPFDVCSERDLVNGGYPRALRGDRSYLDP